CITVSTITVTGSASLDVIGITATWGAYSATAASFPVYIDVSGVAEGTMNDLVVDAIDVCGNTATIDTVTNVQVDTVAPVVSIISPTDGECIGTSAVVVSGSLTEAGSGVYEITVEAGAYSATGTAFPITLVIPTDGVYTITARVEDNCGNIGSDAVANVRVDTAVDSVSLSGPTPGSCINSTVVTVTGSASDTGSGLLRVEVTAVGPATFSATAPDFSAPIDLDITTDGVYQITATAWDNCGNSLASGPITGIRVDTAAPAVTIIQPTTGEIVGTDTVVVKFTADDLGSGVDTASGIVSIDGTTQAATYSAPTFTAVFNGVANGNYTATACVDDLCGNAGGCASVSFSVGFAMSILAPTNGGLVVTVNGITYGSVIASIPFELTWVNGTSPYDTSGLTVLADGLTTLPGPGPASLLSVISPTNASGRILVACDDSAGSFGTVTNVTITAYGVSDAIGPAAPGTVTVTVQLGEIGVEDVVIVESVTSFTAAVNAYYDSSLAGAFESYDIIVGFTPTIVKVGPNALNNCAGDNPVSGSSGVFAATEFSATPTVSYCSNTRGEIRLSAVQSASTTSPVGFFNVANINFVKVGAVSSSMEFTVTLIDFCNSSGDCYATLDVPAGYPWAVWPAYIKNGRVSLPSICKVDTTADVTITFPVNGVTVTEGDVTVTGTADSDISTVIVASDQGHNKSSLVVGGIWSVGLTGVTTPSIVIDAQGTDDCGNIGSDSVTVPVESAVCTISSVTPATGCPLDDVTIDGANFGPTTGTVVFDATSASVISWSVTSIVVDAPGGVFGNVTVNPTAGGSCVQGGAYSYDDVLPVVTIVSPTDGECIATSTVAVDASSDGGEAVTCTLDGGNPLVAPGSWTLVADGPHTIECTSTDACGNDSLPVSVTVTVDTALPVVTIVSPTDGECITTSTV
ncbi:MAG: hypothetical protein JSU92_04315, partial [Deltaproteobacteria bacterium]